MKITAKKGTWVVLYFDDHVEDGSRPMSCMVAGKLVKKGPKYVTLASWYVLARPGIQKVNNKDFTILTSTIKGYAEAWTGNWLGRRPDGM